MRAAAEDATFSETRATARRIFLESLSEINVQKAFQKNLEIHRGVLRVCEDLYDLRSFAKVFAAAIGKAARPMAESLVALLGTTVGGIVVEPESAATEPMIPGFKHFYGGHPAPNAESLAAAKAVLKALHAEMRNGLAIFLLSGGGSAMLEAPLDDELNL